MPEWTTHVCAAYLIARALKINKHSTLVLLGAILPDAFKFFIPLGMLIGFGAHGNFISNFFAPLHTIFGVLLTGALASSFFNLEWRHAYSLVLLGISSHLALDLLIWPYGTKIWTLWPLVTWQSNLGFIWPDSVLPAAVSLLAFIIVYRGV